MNSFMAKKDEFTVSQLIKSILNDTGYLKQLETLRKLKIKAELKI